MNFNGTIFVEGEADLKFITDFVFHKFNYSLEKGTEIQEVKGKDNLKEFEQRFKASSDRDFINLLIFDADTSYQETNKELEQRKVDVGIQFNAFLFPDNNEAGDLESLLEKIINPDYKVVFDCFERFRSCINEIPAINDKALNRKTKIHNYISVLSDPESAKEKNRNYRNSKLWNLNSDQLTPLFDFLSPYFIQDEN